MFVKIRLDGDRTPGCSPFSGRPRWQHFHHPGARRKSLVTAINGKLGRRVGASKAFYWQYPESTESSTGESPQSPPAWKFLDQEFNNSLLPLLKSLITDNHFVTSFVDPWDKVFTVPGFWSIIMCFLWYRAQSKAIHQATLRWGNDSHIFQLLLDSCGIPTCRAGHKKMAPPVSRENRVYSGAPDSPGSIFMPPSGFPKVTTVLFCNTAAKALPVE